ncbi:HD family hydrolase [Candidatus Woesearchaeota archaeon]|nr:HD family hydrolase [Candidatus Woesearchaeota archaeon]MBT5272661.1 HD family hydrolase [Candidatus Woesearchaeota archaeon]MBT6041702.1 HD family hydrolase [Candidatus Woesearchaeota archaeon]MBT6337213.1 HD family hydrolase [Candidatus Woesearchaeota archaeon]MBT7928149.1 HD family hydrolase [Candidatus Woesearchaeota archaeon]
MKSNKLINLIFELGQLKRVKHEGWRLVGVEHPESVAEHSLRAAQIGYLIAKLEGYKNPEEICAMLVFHDMAETRVGDIHKVANRYVKRDEKSAAKAQTKELGKLGIEIFKLWETSENIKTVQGIIVKDADLLDMAFMAKEYMEQGHKYAKDWIHNIEKRLKTKTAKKLLSGLKKTHSNEWWKGLKKIKTNKI